jgi:hypothetical protein
MGKRKEIEFTATLLSATRKGLSRNGNPTWELVTDAGVYRTQTDSSLGYSMGNHTNTRSDEYLIGKRVAFTATPAGRVFGMRLA